MSTNGQHRSGPVVSFDDAATLARMVVIGALLGDRQALTDITTRRPDLDIQQLVLMAEVALAVNVEMMKPGQAHQILYGSMEP
jgi:hypothetical protein